MGASGRIRCVLLRAAQEQEHCVTAKRWGRMPAGYEYVVSNAVVG